MTTEQLNQLKNYYAYKEDCLNTYKMYKQQLEWFDQLNTENGGDLSIVDYLGIVRTFSLSKNVLYEVLGVIEQAMINDFTLIKKEVEEAYAAIK